MAGDDADATHPPAREDPPRRPARRGQRAGRPITTRPDFEPLPVTTHRELVVRQPAIVERLHAHPELATMVFVNPVLAFREFGVSLTPELADHLLRTLQHPPALRARREALERTLTERLGAPPRPDDPPWLAATLFRTLQLEPLETAGREPTYRSPLPPDRLERLERLRPTFRNVRGDRPRRLAGMAVRLAPWRPAVRRMDLDAPVPELPRARDVPAAVTLEELYFYKDASPIARDLLELGIIRRRAFPVHSGDSYRKVRAGEKANAFRGWITGLRFRSIRDERDEGPR